MCVCTSNRVIQHYTRNPLEAYTGDIPTPIISIQYVLRTDEEHTGKEVSMDWWVRRCRQIVGKV